MSYTAPYLDDTGFYFDTLENLISQLVDDCKSIYGQDIYLENDSADYQWIVTIAEYIYDTLQIAQLVYNNRAPNTALKSALDSIVKINGIKRQTETYSTCTVTITGVSGTIITGGVIYDKGNILWDLPSTVTIPTAGTIDVIATCQVAGAIVANAGELIGIYNPTYGWNGVYNSSSATLGSVQETDSELRKRQATSVASPSNTLLEGTKGAIAAVTGVTRSQVYENDTGAVDSQGLPAHSITAVVENGSDSDIAEAIFKRKGPGCYSNGDVSVTVTDSENETSIIRFYRPTYVDIDVVVNVKKISKYTTSTTSSIKTALETYLNSLDIGTDLTVSSLWGTAVGVMTDLANPTFSVTGITVAKHSGTQSTSDITIKYNEVCRGDTNYITVNVS